MSRFDDRIRAGIRKIAGMAGETGKVGTGRQDLERIRLPGDAKLKAAPNSLKGPRYSVTAWYLALRTSGLRWRFPSSLAAGPALGPVLPGTGAF